MLSNNCCFMRWREGEPSQCLSRDSSLSVATGPWGSWVPLASWVQVPGGSSWDGLGTPGHHSLAPPVPAEERRAREWPLEVLELPEVHLEDWLEKRAERLSTAPSCRYVPGSPALGQEPAPPTPGACTLRPLKAPPCRPVPGPAGLQDGQLAGPGDRLCHPHPPPQQGLCPGPEAALERTRTQGPHCVLLLPCQDETNPRGWCSPALLSLQIAT